MPIKVLSRNSNGINHTSGVPKGWFNPYKVHRVSVREPFTHITFCFSGRCSVQLCTRGNQTGAQLLWKSVLKVCSTQCASEKSTEKASQLCLVSALLHVNKVRYSGLKRLKYTTENRGALSLGAQNCLLLQKTIGSCSFFSKDLPLKKKYARAF